MKRLAFGAAATLALLLLPCGAWAQSTFSSRPTLMIDGGAAFPTGDVGDNYEFGFTLGAGASIPIGPIRLGVEANYNRFPLDKDEVLRENGVFDNRVDVDGGDFSAFTAFGKVMLPLHIPESPFTPYLLAGGGFLHAALDDFTVEGEGQSVHFEGDDQNSIALTFGAGVDYALGPGTAVFAEGRYTLGLGDNDNIKFIPVKLGFRFGL